MEPRDAVIAFITRPAVPATSSKAGPGGWTATTYRGGQGHQANAATIRVIRERVRGGGALVAVEYDDTAGDSWFYVYGVQLQADGNWRVSGGAGGSAAGEPARSAPWANLGGWGNDTNMCAGGRVHGDGVRRVRLTSPDGRTFEDHVESGIALITGKVPFGTRFAVDLLDGAGAVLGTHPWP